MDHRTTHGEHCSCHSCAPSGRWDLGGYGAPGSPARTAYIASRFPDGVPKRTFGELWGYPQTRPVRERIHAG